MKKDLILYFSRADENYKVGYVEKGNTEIVAEILNDLINADIFKIEPLVPYAKDYATCIQEAKLRVGNAPIKDNINDLTFYNTIYILTPIYWGTYAPEVETAIKSLDFTGKKVRVITTHEGSGLANVVSDLEKNCKGAEVDTNGLAILGHEAGNSLEAIKAWL